MAPAPTQHRVAPRIPPEEVQQWFRECGRCREPYPDLEQCIRISAMLDTFVPITGVPDRRERPQPAIGAVKTLLRLLPGVRAHWEARQRTATESEQGTISDALALVSDLDALLRRADRHRDWLLEPLTEVEVVDHLRVARDVASILAHALIAAGHRSPALDEGSCLAQVAEKVLARAGVVRPDKRAVTAGAISQELRRRGIRQVSGPNLSGGGS